VYETLDKNIEYVYSCYGKISSRTHLLRGVGHSTNNYHEEGVVPAWGTDIFTIDDFEWIMTSQGATMTFDICMTETWNPYAPMEW